MICLTRGHGSAISSFVSRWPQFRFWPSLPFCSEMVKGSQMWRKNHFSLDMTRLWTKCKFDQNNYCRRRKTRVRPGTVSTRRQSHSKVSNSAYTSSLPFRAWNDEGSYLHFFVLLFLHRERRSRRGVRLHLTPLDSDSVEGSKPHPREKSMSAICEFRWCMLLALPEVLYVVLVIVFPLTDLLLAITRCSRKRIWRHFVLRAEWVSSNYTPLTTYS